MKLTITSLYALISFASLTGCGSFSDETKIEIQMYGISKVAASASGNHDPQFQTYEVESITLESATEPVELIDKATPYKVVGRPQIILSRDAEDLKDRAFTGVTIVFRPEVIGGDSSESSLSFLLSQPKLTSVQPFKVGEGKTTSLVVKAAWANTMGAEGMTEPTLEITMP